MPIVDQGSAPAPQPPRRDQLPPQPPLSERPPWELTGGWARAVAVITPVFFVVVITAVVAAHAWPVVSGAGTWRDALPHPPSANTATLFVAALCLAGVGRLARREFERRLEPRLRPVEALVVDRRWRPAPRSVGGTGAGASRGQWAAVLARPYQATLEYVVDGRVHRQDVFTAEEPLVGTTMTVRVDERNPRRLRP